MVELGGFGFSVDVNLASAQAKLQQLGQLAQQSAQQVQAAFRATSVTVNTQQAQQAVQQLGQRIQQIQQGSATVLLRADGTPFLQAVAQAEAATRRLGGSAATISIQADTSRLEVAYRRAEQAGIRTEQRLAEAAEATAARRAAAADRAAVREEAAYRRAESAGVRSEQRQAEAAAARAGRSQGFFQQAGQGAVQQLTPGLSSSAAVAVGVVAAQQVQALTAAVADGIKAGIQYNAMLETSAAQFKVFTGSAGLAEESLKRLRRFADLTPFDTAETIRSGQVFAQVAGGNIARMERLVQLAGQLAAVNPDRSQGGGLEGGTIALRAALSGDTQSLRDRFNVDPAAIERIKQLGLAGTELAEAYVKAAGGSDELVKALGETFEGRLSTAKAHFDDLSASATKPIFDVLATGLARFNAAFDESAPRLKQLAAFGPAVLAAFVPGGALVAGALAVNAANKPADTTPTTGLSALDAIHEQRTAAANAALDDATKKLTDQKKIVEEVGKDLDRNAAAARVITEAYAEQLRPLEAQARLLDGRIRDNQAQGREIAARARAAQGPVETRAQVAGTQVELEHEQQIIDIRHRRAEIAEQIGTAEQAISQRVAEADIRGAEQALRATQERAQAESQARQDALDGLREEVRGRQEARQAAIEGLRDQISAQQEQRRSALEGIQDEIRARREAVDLAKEAAQEASRAAQEAFQDQERAADRGHQAVMQHYHDQIEALQAQTRERQGQSDAERQLAALDRADRARSEQERLADAQRAVGRATTLRGRQDALRGLNRAEADVASERQRDALQERIAKEKEAADARRAKIADQIAAIEQQAREADRAYQRDKDAREEAFRVQQRAEQVQQRQEEQAERARRRAEDAQVRAITQANQQQDKADQAALRAAEQQAQAADRADQAQLRQEERAARDADRAAQRDIAAQQQAIQARRDALAADQAATETARDIGRLARLHESADVEQRILDNRQRALDAIDVRAAAAAAADKVRNDAQAAALADQKAANDDLLAGITARRDLELDYLDRSTKLLEIKRDRAKEVADELQKGVDAAAAAVKALSAPGPAITDARAADEGPHEGGRPGAFAGLLSQAKAAADAIGALGTNAASSLGAGIASWFASDTTTKAATTDWTQQDIIDPVEQLLEIHSPSHRAEGWAQALSDGFVSRMQSEQRAIVDALEAPWIEVDTRFFPEVERKWERAGEDQARAYADGWERARLAQLVEDQIEAILLRIRNDEPRFRTAGHDAGVHFTEGFCHNLGLIDCVAKQFEWMIANAEAYGTQVGAKFTSGFQQTAQPSGGGGSTGGGNPANDGRYRPADGSAQLPEHLRALGWTREVINGETWFLPPAAHRATGGSRQAPHAISRDGGGPLEPGQLYRVHQDEYIIPTAPGYVLPKFRDAGSVMPAAMTARALSGAGSGSGALAVGGGGGVTINVPITFAPGSIVAAPGTNVEDLANRVVDKAVTRAKDEFSSALLEHARNYPRRVPASQPGAR